MIACMCVCVCARFFLFLFCFYLQSICLLVQQRMNEKLLQNMPQYTLTPTYFPFSVVLTLSFSLFLQLFRCCSAIRTHTHTHCFDCIANGTNCFIIRFTIKLFAYIAYKSILYHTITKQTFSYNKFCVEWHSCYASCLQCAHYFCF